MFALTVLAVTFSIATTVLKRGRAAGFCAAWAAVFLCPAWMERTFGAFSLTPRLVAVSLAVAGLIVFQDNFRLNKRLVFLDLLVAAVTCVELTSMHFSRELTITMFAQSIGFWCVPYIFGRLIATSDLNRSGLITVSMWVICILTCWGLVEAVAGFNPVNALLGRADYGGSFRWGLRRAEGPLQHPIHFGNMMLMLFPWTIEAARRGFQGRGPEWWRIMPFVGFLGTFSSLSRGPLIGLFIISGLVCFLQMPRFRPILINIGFVALALILMNATGAMDTLQKSSGEENEWGPYMVSIEGEEYEYTGTNHRMLQFLVFKQPLADVGLVGFGTWGIKPKHIAYVEPKLRAKFWSIDNHYILLTLRSGYAGLCLFFAIGGTALSYALRLGVENKSDAVLASGMCGAVLASMILLLSVWFAPDFAFVWLISVGLVGGWWAKAMSTRDKVRAECVH